MSRWATVVVDPPWDVPLGPRIRRRAGDGSFKPPWEDMPYRRMSLANICALRVQECLAADAWCILWVPTRFVAEAPAVLRAWAVEHRGWWAWDKKDGPQHPGSWRRNLELLAVGSVGAPKWLTTTNFGAVIRMPRPRLAPGDEGWADYERKCSANGATCPPPRWIHSAKPDGFYADLLSRTHGPHLEIFARRIRDGWDGWGDQFAGDPASISL